MFSVEVVVSEFRLHFDLCQAACCLFGLLPFVFVVCLGCLIFFVFLMGCYLFLCFAFLSECFLGRVHFRFLAPVVSRARRVLRVSFKLLLVWGGSHQKRLKPKPVVFLIQGKLNPRNISSRSEGPPQGINLKIHPNTSQFTPQGPGRWT